MACNLYEVVPAWVGITGSAGKVFVLSVCVVPSPRPLPPRGLSSWYRDSQKGRKARVDLGPRDCSGLLTSQLRPDDLLLLDMTASQPVRTTYN